MADTDDDDLGGSPDDDETLPWADPAIRTEYEAALGRLVLAFNEVDYRITEVIKYAVAKLGDSSPLRRLASGTTAQRIENLALLMALPSEPCLHGINLDELRRLNGLRNIVAHGHFDQNPFDGSYDLIGQRGYKDQARRTERDFPASRLEEITAEMEAASIELRYAEIAFQFDDVALAEVVSKRCPDPT